MEIHLKIIGLILVALAAVHVIFPRYFNWKVEFVSLSLVNRQMMYIHTLFIAVVVLLMGLLCISSSSELIETTLGRRISLGLGLFWFLRLVIQFVGYSPKLWRGKRFETVVHIVFALLWSYLSVVFLWIYVM